MLSQIANIKPHHKLTVVKLLYWDSCESGDYLYMSDLF